MFGCVGTVSLQSSSFPFSFTNSNSSFFLFYRLAAGTMSLPQTYCRYIIVGDCPWGDKCRFRHDIVGCSCGLAIQLENLRAHTRGKRHRQLLAELQVRKETEWSGVSSVPVSFIILALLSGVESKSPPWLCFFAYSSATAQYSSSW